MTAADKKVLDRIYDKHYGPDAKRMKGNKAKKENDKITKVMREKKENRVTEAKTSHQDALCEAITTGVGIVDQAKLGSRADLMAEAKKRGIKYFRILTKDELVEVLSQTDQNYINGIIENAKKRWQTGWGKNKKAGE